jgi:hypothetical protein
MRREGEMLLSRELEINKLCGELKELEEIIERCSDWSKKEKKRYIMALKRARTVIITYAKGV